jgi:hypothetical protein
MMEGSSKNNYRESGESKIPNKPSTNKKVQSSDWRSNTERKEGALRWYASLYFYRVLAMVYNTQNYWGFGLYPSSGF